MAVFYSDGVGGNYPERVTIETTATINSQNIANNTSNVTITVKAWYNYGQYTAPDPIGDAFQYIRLDNVETPYAYSGYKNVDFTGTSSSKKVTLMSWTGNIAHNSDGTKTVEIDVYQNCPGVTTLSYLFGTHLWTLTTIPRTSTPTVSTEWVELGNAVTVYTNRLATSLTHSLYYAFGSASGLIANGITDSHAWTLPLDLAWQIPNATYATLTFTLETYSGATLVGSKTVSMYPVVPNNATFKPTAAFNNITEGTAGMVGAGAYIAGKSSLYVSSTATGKYGASVPTYSVNVNGSGYSGTAITSAVISSTGNIGVTLTVTDSRGYSNSVYEEKPFVALAAPTLSASSVALGSAITVYTNRAATPITHTLTYSYGAQTGTVATGVGASSAWTLPATMANGLPSATSGTVTVTQNSYNGAYHIGTKTVTFTATIPNNATYQPTAVINSITEGSSGLTAFTVFIQSKSKLVVSSTATPKYGASITQTKVTIDTDSYYGTSVTSAVINKSGSIPITLLVTDSRGYTSSVPTTRNFVAYTTPQITTFTAARSPNEQSTDLSAPVNFTISPISNQNTKSYTLRYKPSGGSWTTAHSSSTLYTLNTTLTKAGVLDGNYSYEVELIVADYFTSVSKMVLIGTAFVLMDFNASGKGIAFGKVSETDSFEVSIPAVFEDGISSKTGGGNIAPQVGIYNATPGVLVDICNDSLQNMILVEVIGNGYSNSGPIYSIFQVYHYTPLGTFLAAGQLNVGAAIGAGKFLIEGGRVKLWFPTLGSWQTIIVKATGSSGSIYMPVVSSSAEPTATYKVTCPVTQR